MRSGKQGGGIQAPRIDGRLEPTHIVDVGGLGEYAQIAIDEADLSDQTASGLVFEEALFRRVLFTGTHLLSLRILDVRFERCDLSGIRWEGARLRRAEVLGSRLVGAQLAEAHLNDVLFRDCNLESAILSAAECRSVRFERCALRNAVLSGARLSGVVFDDCDLSGAELQGAELQETDLRTCNISGLHARPADLQGVIIAPHQAEQVVGLFGLIVREADHDSRT